MAVTARDLQISVVVPCFNEEGAIVDLAREIRDALLPLEHTFEIIVVDDASTDGSVAALERARESLSELVVVRHGKNCGQSAAIASGFEKARGEIVVTLDGDGQNDPSDIKELLARLDGADAVCGTREKRHDDFIRRLSSRVGNGFRNAITRDTIKDTGCALRAMRREALAELPVFNGMHRFLPTLLRLQGFRVVETPVKHRPRTTGVSKYGVRNRAFRGLVDCLAILWWRRRMVPARRLHPVELREEREPDRKRKGSRAMLALVVLAVACLVVVYATPFRGILESWFAPEDAAFRDLGGFGGALFVGVATLLIAFGTPRLLLAAIAGILYGWWLGALLAEAATLLGCLVTFRLGRWLGRDYVEQRIGTGWRRLGFILEKVREHGVACNVLIRSAPVGNFFATNLLMAISPISLRDLFLGTLIGTLPSTFVLALLGADARERAGLMALIGCAIFLSWALVFWLIVRPRFARRIGLGSATEGQV